MRTDLTHVMVDLETLGTVPGCSILSIGAVVFFPEEERLGDNFYAVVNRPSCREHMLFEQEDTIAWWSRQSADAQKLFLEANTGGDPLPVALNQFNSWLQRQGQVSKIRLYGNGADFDNPILRVAFDCAKVKPYPGAFGGRCYRTLKNLDELLGPDFEFQKLSSAQRTGTHHNALDDAISQAKHLMQSVARIKALLASHA